MLAQKPEVNEDLRVRRTRKLLQQALIELTVIKGFAAITVRDITERAMVNRSTFYRHYLDKYDLLDQYMNELYESSFSSEEGSSWAQNPGQTSPGAPPGLVNLLKHVQAFAHFYCVMLGPKGDREFTERFRQITEKRFRFLLSNKTTEPDPNAPPNNLRAGYVSYASIGAIVWWLENDQPCSPEQLAGWLSQLSRAITGL